MTTSAVVHFVAGKWSGGVACGRSHPPVSTKDAHVVSCESCKRTVEFVQKSV
jgi:hypothetical protein